MMEVVENAGTWYVCSTCTHPSTYSEAIGDKKSQSKTVVHTFSKDDML